MENSTIHLGSLQPMATVAYWAESQQAGPKRQPTAHGAQLERGQHARTMRSTCGHRGQCTRCCAELYDGAAAYRRQGLHLRHTHGSNYEPQYLNLEEVVGKRGLTSEAIGVAATDGVEGGNYG
jgi:hypothetical protein